LSPAQWLRRLDLCRASLSSGVATHRIVVAERVGADGYPARLFDVGRGSTAACTPGGTMHSVSPSSMSVA
jgi:hypothetical protein